MTDNKRVAIYSRVSKAEGQRPEVQTSALVEYANGQGWKIVRIYEDSASAMDGRGRVAWNALIQDMERRKFEMLLVWKLDRAFRSVIHASNTIKRLNVLGIDFFSLSDPGLDTSSPQGQFLINILASVAELERETIIQRINAGISHSRQHGTKSGRPIGRPKVRVNVKNLYNAYREQGNNLRAAARKLGINPGTARNKLREKGYID